jgi:hypothetical protein
MEQVELIIRQQKASYADHSKLYEYYTQEIFKFEDILFGLDEYDQKFLLNLAEMIMKSTFPDIFESLTTKNTKKKKALEQANKLLRNIIRCLVSFHIVRVESKMNDEDVEFSIIQPPNAERLSLIIRSPTDQQTVIGYCPDVYHICEFDSTTKEGDYERPGVLTWGTQNRPEGISTLELLKTTMTDEQLAVFAPILIEKYECQHYYQHELFVGIFFNKLRKKLEVTHTYSINREGHSIRDHYAYNADKIIWGARDLNDFQLK